MNQCVVIGRERVEIGSDVKATTLKYNKNKMKIK